MKSKGIAIWGLLLLVTSCAKAPGPDPDRRPDATYDPILISSEFLANGDCTNPYFLHSTGKTFVYAGHTEDGNERIEIMRLSESTLVADIPCGILLEKAWINGELVEQSWEYYAEDLEGNVWALGTDVDNFNSSGALINHHGSWNAGVDGAKPGIAMLPDPQIGLLYRQEYYFNVSENQAEVVETGITVSTSMTTFQNCIVIREWSELEPDILEYKMYAPGVGLVKEVNLSTGDVIELVDIR